MDALSPVQRQLSDALRAALAEQQPVTWLPSAEWTACVKLPVTVHVRQQRPGETHVSTREGITPIKPDDLIMRGVSGEEYPIGREIFERTYRLDEAPQPANQPLTIEEIYECERIAVIRHHRHKNSIRGQQITPADDPQWHFANAIIAAYERKNGIGEQP